MSSADIVEFDANTLRLPSCVAVHAQLRPDLKQLSPQAYADHMQELCRTKQSHVCGILGGDPSASVVLALSFYRAHPTTYDTIRFEVYDLVVDENERSRGLGSRVFRHLIEQAKLNGAPSVVLQCDLTNTGAHRFFFRHGLEMSSFGFYLDKIRYSEDSEQMEVIDASNNEELILRAQGVYRQLRPILSEDQQAYLKEIRNICQTGPAHMLVAVSNDAEKAVLGIAMYRVANHIKYAKHIYCDDLITDQSKRSSGVGRALVNGMKKEAERLGLARIALDSGCQRGRAHKFYHREGFRIDQFEMTLLF